MSNLQVLCQNHVQVIKDCFPIKQEDNEPTVQFVKRHRMHQDLLEDQFGKIDTEEAIKTTPKCLKLCDKDGNSSLGNEDDTKDPCENTGENSPQVFSGV